MPGRKLWLDTHPHPPLVVRKGLLLACPNQQGSHFRVYPYKLLELTLAICLSELGLRIWWSYGLQGHRCQALSGMYGDLTQDWGTQME